MYVKHIILTFPRQLQYSHPGVFVGSHIAPLALFAAVMSRAPTMSFTSALPSDALPRMASGSGARGRRHRCGHFVATLRGMCSIATWYP